MPLSIGTLTATDPLPVLLLKLRIPLVHLTPSSFDSSFFRVKPQAILRSVPWFRLNLHDACKPEQWVSWFICMKGRSSTTLPVFLYDARKARLFRLACGRNSSLKPRRSAEEIIPQILASQCACLSVRCAVRTCALGPGVTIEQMWSFPRKSLLETCHERRAYRG